MREIVLEVDMRIYPIHVKWVLELSVKVQKFEQGIHSYDESQEKSFFGEMFVRLSWNKRFFLLIVI